MLAALVCGCAAERFELEIDPAFSPGRRVALEAAAHEWMSAGASLGRIRVVQGDPIEDSWGAQFHGGTITIRPEVLDSDFYTLALHEFGHAAAGTDAHHYGRGVMREWLADSLPCITPTDLALVGLDGPGTCGER